MALIKLADANLPKSNPLQYDISGAFKNMKPAPMQSYAGSTVPTASVAGTPARPPQAPAPAKNPLVNTAYASTGAGNAGVGAANPSLANTYSNGVNGYGQQLPGYGSASNVPSSIPSTYTPPAPVQENPQPTGTGVGNNQTDRFAVLDRLRDSASSYFQPSQDETDTMQALGNLVSSRDLGINKIMSTPDTMDVLTGTSDYLSKQAQAQSQPLQAKLGILQARRQAAIQGYQAALGAEQTKQGFSQPVSLGIGQGLYSPTSGQQVAGNADYNSLSGGSGGGGLIGSLAQQVVNNQLTPSQAISQLPSSALAGALNQAINQIKPGFDFTAAEQNAVARGQQLNQNVTLVQPLKLAMNTALDHIKGLQDIVNKVGYSDSGLLNNLRTTFSDNISSDQNIKTLQSQISLVREEVAKVLGGGTATDSSRADANAIVPMNISPTQFANVIQQVQQRMQEKIDEYSKLGNPSQYGGAPTTTQSSGSSPWSF